jgi:beta-N-acetylhexosaminidase
MSAPGNFEHMIRLLRYGLGSLFLLSFLFPVDAQNHSARETKWVDSVFASLPPDARIAQLFMISAYSNKGAKAEAEVAALITQYQPGGVIFFQGTPGRQASLTNAYQKISRVPMLVAGDYEWGLAMRLDSVPKYPWQMTLGAIKDESLVVSLAARMADEFKRIGVNVSFSPSLDINNNALNPIIGSRSFGDSRENVVRLGAAFIKGLQDNGVLACGKHFPGHGDTDRDSHKALPIIPFSRQRLDSLELFPFRRLARSGLGSIMVAHLFIPELDSTLNLPSSLSRKIIHDLLRKELGFDGLIFTDAMNMKGVAGNHPKGVADVKALKAGVDIVLMPGDLALGIQMVKDAVASGELNQGELDEKCRRILRTKYTLGLHAYKPADVSQIGAYLNSPESQVINRRLASASITLLHNENETVPIRELEKKKLALVRLGSDTLDVFANTLKLYAPMEVFTLKDGFSQMDAESVLNALEGYDPVIVSVHKSDKTPWKSYKINESEKSFLVQASQKHRIVLNVFASPYSIQGLPRIKGLSALLLSHQNNPFFAEASAQVIFGGIGAQGVLPVTLSETLPAGFGLASPGGLRFRYILPEEAGIDSKKLNRVQQIAEEGIQMGAFPGCQILAAKDGQVFYRKAFGHHTYDKKQAVELTDLYDIASVSKIASTLAAVMKMYDYGALNLSGKFGDYVPVVQGTNKENLHIEDILTHQAGLKAWIPFYKNTIDAQNNRLPYFYSSVPTPEKSTQVADQMYILTHYRDSMFIKMFASTLQEQGKYVYSDLGFYFMQALVERWTGKRLDQYVNTTFFQPLGAYTCGYNPLTRFEKERIVPTEYDSVWRKQLVHGFVHDQGAAMMGGVAGHAGLFSHADDLAKIMQMYLNKGTYGGTRFFSENTVAEFTKCRFCADGNRRALGFDRPDPSGKGTPCDCVSYLSFGHTGFTGTMAWADPETGLLYIFLSNRVHPDAENKLLMNKDIRGRIQEVFYNAFIK